MLFIPLLAAACGGDPAERVPSAADPSSTPFATLLDTHWQLIAVNDQAVATRPPPNDAHLVLASADGGVAGNSGCNRFSGAYEREGDTLTLGPLATTRMACADTMELESRVLAALSSVDRYELVERELRLCAGADCTLTFVAVD